MDWYGGLMALVAGLTGIALGLFIGTLVLKALARKGNRGRRKTCEHCGADKVQGRCWWCDTNKTTWMRESGHDEI